ncbi:MAG: hypothetical protein IIB44_02355 [Candidatus Marinimicrobia bacterium]|nr:hypothetical protein [Candidatus Neomarinimicrobiota bacterium]
MKKYLKIEAMGWCMCGDSKVGILACLYGQDGTLSYISSGSIMERESIPKVFGTLNQIKTPEGACESNTVRFRRVSLPATLVSERQYRGLNVLIRTASCEYSLDRKISYQGFLGEIYHIFKKE